MALEASNRDRGLYLVLISVHGLIRGHDLELGRDADTGGQTKYVVELARALTDCPEVERVDLVTRLVRDERVSHDYARPEEDLGGGARIVRLEAGPDEYIHKEALWDYLSCFVDNAVEYLREQGRMPDVIHSHYADAGFVGTHLASLLGTPLIHTGHSLGRAKRRRLLARGLDRDAVEREYNITRRVEAEEETLATADLIVASTHNEIEEQYGLYDYYRPETMVVIPPGTDLTRFHPPNDPEPREREVAQEIARFLREPDKPMILALSRPDERKNIATLVQAFGESPELQEKANLVIIVGNRDDIRDLEPGSRKVLEDLLLLIDRFDLYGKVAYPKHHAADDVPLIYRLAARHHGVFVNPALTEPFGLTLIEAAASGLPIVATEDGGPQDIVAHCHNGSLINPLDAAGMARALQAILDDPDHWETLAANGLEGVEAHYSWQAHARKYLDQVQRLTSEEAERPQPATFQLQERPLFCDRAVIIDLDHGLANDPASREKLIELLRARREKNVNVGFVSGRQLEAVLGQLKQWAIPLPDLLITGMGTEIYYAPRLTADLGWIRHIDHLWHPSALRRILEAFPGLEPQPKSEQLPFKLSYYYDPLRAPSRDELIRELHKSEQSVSVFLTEDRYLDILPVRASKGFALRYFAYQWGIPLEHILVAGGADSDEDMMRGNTLGVVVADRHEALDSLRDLTRVYFAEQAGAAGIFEAIDHYDFFGTPRVPTEREVEE